MKFSRIVWILSLVCLCSIAAFAARPTPLKQFLALGAIFAIGILFLICLGRLLTRKKGEYFRAGIIAIAVLTVVPLSVELGHAIRDWQFQRDLPRYRAAAAWASTLAVPGQTVTVLSPPAAYADFIDAVHVSQDDVCGLQIDFFWGSGFPVKHTVRRYVADSSSMERRPCMEGWRRSRKRAEGWFEIAD